MRETWYVLESGAVVDPASVGPDAKGVLRHKSGVAVAMRNQTPVSRGVDNPAAERARAAEAEAAAAKEADEKAKADAAKKIATGQSKDIKPAESKAGYVTRETKAQ
jgi:hypothetical protein